MNPSSKDLFITEIPTIQELAKYLDMEALIVNEIFQSAKTEYSAEPLTDITDISDSAESNSYPDDLFVDYFQTILNDILSHPITPSVSEIPRKLL